MTCTYGSSAFAKSTKSLYWRIQNTSWNDQFELSYQQFIHTLGIARKNNLCHTTDQCLRSPVANPRYAALNPRRLNFIYSDCADLPYVLRAYFSWMNDLPFSFESELMAATSLSFLATDIRYSRFGNIITGKDQVFDGESINQVLQKINDTVSSAMFRTNASTSDSGYFFRDTYPTAINRDAIAPGTVLYDPNGHVAVVYDVTSNGKIYLIDAHPDNSLSAITYGEKFARSRLQIGGGFSNFRPYYQSENSIIAKRNYELPNYSLIQYQTEPFIFKGQVVSFYEYVRAVLAEGIIIYNPLGEFTDQLSELCQDILYREEAVNTSLASMIQESPHPDFLPANIYGADGDWEAYATPARDARLKASVRGIKDYLEKIIRGYKNHSVQIIYHGVDLVKDLREIYLTKSESCSVNARANFKINMDFILKNIFALSFDPYHCAELRWGILGNNSCSSTANKMAWYTAEQGLRNRIDRDNNIKTDYDVNTLPNAPVSQVPKPDLSFDKILEITRTYN